MGSGMGLWMMGGGLMMIPIWTAIIGLALWAIRAATRGPGGGTQQEQPGHSLREPIEIAKERYARGDITRDAYRQLRQDLQAAERKGSDRRD